MTGGLGSICSGSFIIAALKAAQYAFEKGENSSNPVVKLIAAAACCAIQWILKLFNSYAFVFVGSLLVNLVLVREQWGNVENRIIADMWLA